MFSSWWLIGVTMQRTIRVENIILKNINKKIDFEKIILSSVVCARRVSMYTCAYNRVQPFLSIHKNVETQKYITRKQ